MAECPDCGRPNHGKACPCGWHPSGGVTYGVSADPASCSTCHGILEARKDYRPYDTSWPLTHCVGCGAHSLSVRAFPDDTPCVEDRGRRVCASCQLPMLRHRATCAHAWAEGRRGGEKCDRCTLEIQGVRELGRAYMERIEARAVHL